MSIRKKSNESYRVITIINLIILVLSFLYAFDYYNDRESLPGMLADQMEMAASIAEEGDIEKMKKTIIFQGEIIDGALSISARSGKYVFLFWSIIALVVVLNVSYLWHIRKENGTE